ncbi:methyltransferase-like protein 13 [Pyrus ussuriensis x Pyrus communis]|uniref:Methyltransferase-like protein 13 n=1 Tax=Pyrus ussuriensis x Pyrus communis TaxID=2448454 RepID=A0A5N5HIN4_9ROSA|nr:methyltransferase-like protein 13 [Pyrus ussuriensis x Pyrus communis]
MVGCGNAVMSEDMVKDGYEDIMNIDISSVAIDMMISKYEHIPQLKYMQMDVRDMSFFPDDSFDGVIDKGTLDSLIFSINLVGNSTPYSQAKENYTIAFSLTTFSRSISIFQIPIYSKLLALRRGIIFVKSSLHLGFLFRNFPCERIWVLSNSCYGPCLCCID